MSTVHVTADDLEEVAFRTGAEISLGGKHPTLEHDGKQYIADVDSAPGGESGE